MHAFRSFIFAKVLQRGLSAIAELLVIVMNVNFSTVSFIVSVLVINNTETY